MLKRIIVMTMKKFIDLSGADISSKKFLKRV